ncbi:MAG: PTS sugar transporter subunit IIA [Treponema sp.]|nr:PTS sugar transporter subunit IIA [Treponema sp.]MBQ2551541.1 PTS sugar transporter subunit IIA [Treponema sp.]MBQ4235845.1 PTS sugar transporter subunit IIA [Treponema sp.]MBQ5383692.1 PTS sugar transporter subunit IIA [Treponema sp.]
MILEWGFSPKTVVMNLESSDKDELFEEMVEAVVAAHPEVDRAQAVEALRERESKMSTGIMHDIAVPHGNCSSVKEVVGAIGISRKGIDYDALDKEPVHLVFMILCNPDHPEMHLSVLKEISSVLQNPTFLKEVLEKKTEQEVYDLLCAFGEGSLA